MVYLRTKITPCTELYTGLQHESLFIWRSGSLDTDLLSGVL